MSSVATGASPEWIAILSALLTPVIALLGAYIAWQQWRTNRNKLKLDLFERRFAIYQAAVDLINSILSSGTSTQQATATLVRSTRSANFIVGKKIMTYLDKELFRRAVRLEVLQMAVHGSMGDDAFQRNLDEQMELKGWLVEQYAVLQRLFARQLNLKH